MLRSCFNTHHDVSQAFERGDQQGDFTVGHTPVFNIDEQNELSEAEENNKAKHAALRYILDAWEEAVYDGIDPDCVATAAIFAALSDMIATYGEEPVARMVERLPERIRIGEFTVARTTQ